MIACCVYWSARVLDNMTTAMPHENWLDEIASFNPGKAQASRAT
jgi:hypothetical protein